ncbi:MAG: hypothetical protein ABWJ63_05620 [Thermus sp.]|uniref:hypothetical protein n=1 Tax=Thermus sp. TaxID=275 RepID=UPI00351B96E1
MGHKDDPQTKVPSSVILLFSHVPSPSRFNWRIHPLMPYLLALLSLLSRLPVFPYRGSSWNHLHQAQGYALDTFPLPTCENIRAPRSKLTPGLVFRF